MGMTTIGRFLTPKAEILLAEMKVVNLWHSIGMNSRATQLKFECLRMSHYGSHYHYGSQSIACSSQ